MSSFNGTTGEYTFITAHQFSFLGLFCVRQLFPGQEASTTPAPGSALAMMRAQLKLA